MLPLDQNGGWLSAGEYSNLRELRLMLQQYSRHVARIMTRGLLQPMLLRPSHDLHSSTGPGICHATRVRPFNNAPVHDRDQSRRPMDLKMVPVHLANDEKSLVAVTRCRWRRLANSREAQN